MRRLIVLGLFTVLAAQAQQRAEGGNFVHLADARVQGVEIETDSESKGEWENDIRNQLHYLVSQLRDINATPGLWHSLKLEIKSVSRGSKAKNRLTYDATFVASWPRNAPLPSSRSAIFPLRGDEVGMEEFEQKYLTPCAHESPLWYYFTPKKPGCPLGQKNLPEDAQWVTLTAEVSLLNTTNKFPEYHKIWEDKKLVITHVMGNMISLKTNAPPDSELHRKFANTYPGATHTTEAQAFSHVTQVSQYNSPSGLIILRTLRILQGNIQGATDAFKSEFQSYMKDSDVISYNGHAGLGKNIRAFSHLLTFTPGRYYLVFLNACVPFAYFDSAMFEAQNRANPNHPWSKHLDILVVTGIGYFAETKDILELIQSLTAQKSNFRNLTPTLDRFAPMVLGEEDNAWPNPF